MTRITRPAFAALLAVVMLASNPSARAQANNFAVEYTIGLYEPQTQYVEMTATFADLDGVALDVHLPTWRPGKYLILDMVGTLTGVHAFAPDRSPRTIAKTSKSTWRIDLAGSDHVTIAYRVYANSLGDRTRHVDDTHAFLDGSAVFLYSDESRNKPSRVTVHAPDGWRTATGLRAQNGSNNVFLAPNYDVLADSPFEIGLHSLIEFDVDGVPHEVVIWGDDDFDPVFFKQDFAAIVAAQRDVFGEMPYDRYVFLIHAVPGAGGGTEHYNSTIMQTSPGRFATKSSFRGFLGLVSHEMFHTWNVKRLRPAGLSPYDYLHENYTKLLWVSEGSTSYYGALTLVRAGITKPDSYLSSLARSIGFMDRNIGATVQSLEESSFDAWTKFNRSTPDSPNTTVSFYGKGALVSLLLDMELRGRTDNAVSFDTVMRDLYENFPLEGTGFTPTDLQNTVERLSGSSFDPFFKQYVRGTAPLPMADALSAAGLELKKGEGEDKPYAGFSVSGSNNSVRRVNADGPAYRAGLNVGDEIIALNGQRMTGDLDKLLKDTNPGDPITLLFFRRDDLRELTFTLDGRNDGRLTLKRVNEPTESQKRVYESWLGQAWPD
jgi:predicted metalloprotease with PDZ domain